MNILLIEDDESIIRLMQIRFMRAGFSVSIARTKKQALELFKQHTNSIILFDGWLAGESSDTCDIIAVIGAVCNGMMIAMSSAPQTRQHQLNAGCTMAMEKLEVIPFMLGLTIPSSDSSESVCA